MNLTLFSFFLGTLAKKPIKDGDTLEASGVVPDKKFIKNYDLAFEFDPNLDPARYHTADIPADVPTTKAPEPSSGSSSSTSASKAPANPDELHGAQLLLEITVENSNGKYNIVATGKSNHWNPRSEFSLGSEFETMRMGEFIEKLGTSWPPFERQGYFLKMQFQ